MKPKYDPRSIEAKWQKVWEDTGLYQTGKDPGREKFYALDMFPYPSGDLHTGHWYHYAPADTFARLQLMKGKNVLHPIGFDAFGLPAENAAIKHNVPPAEWTKRNIERMSAQLRQIGPMFDWGRVINTSEPDYYRWTQWLFLQLYDAGLAYRAKGWQNWCPKDQTVLANEQVIGEDRVCERCGTRVEKKELEQWFFKITDYAERLLADLDKVTWPQKVKTMQINWIGRSQGAEINFRLRGLAIKPQHEQSVTVFTTRADTLGGATFVVVSPELAQGWIESGWKASEEVKQYIISSLRRSEIERGDEARAKTGIDTGVTAINPLTQEEVPVWAADYVLGAYGTGAIMAVPAHDQRDNDFAIQFKLPIREAVRPIDSQNDSKVFTGEGKLTGSGEFDGLIGEEARRAIVSSLEEKGLARSMTNYRLRDWLISRQRYWGAPIPIIYCDSCGVVPVPEDQLPVLLPTDVEFKPTGRSPLEDRPDFYETTCPQCSGPARRETDTMDTFVDSSWYYLRYPNPDYNAGPFDPEAVKQWLPVDQYIGGVEHAILHLLYSRFITKFLHDQKLISFDEPFKKLFNQGLILGPDGQKMSKSRDNVVNPDDWVSKYGSDAFRMYLMFLGPYDQGGPFDTKGIAGVWRYLVRVWDLVHEFVAAAAEAGVDTVMETRMQTLMHKLSKKVGEDIAGFAFNTNVAALMDSLNQLQQMKQDYGLQHRASWEPVLKTYLRLLAPSAPHLTEELWSLMGERESIFLAGWPEYDPDMIRDVVVEIVVQVNGKLRATLTVAPETPGEELERLASAHANVAPYLKGKQIIKTIVLERKLVNFVVAD